MLTPKQEKFAQCVASGMTQADAYREAYNCKPTTKPQTVQSHASRLMADGKVSARVEELRAPAIDRLGYTLEKLVEELEEARALAAAIEKPSAMISATMGKAKLLGFDKIETEGDDSVADALLKIAQSLPN